MEYNVKETCPNCSDFLSQNEEDIRIALGEMEDRELENLRKTIEEFIFSSERTGLSLDHIERLLRLLDDEVENRGFLRY